MARQALRGWIFPFLAISFSLSLACAPALASLPALRASPPSEVTPKDAVGQDTNPRMVSHGGALHLFWSGNGRDGQDHDIVHMSYDGLWSEPEIITQSDGEANDHTPFPVSFNGELWVFWSSEDPTLTSGTRADILCAKYVGGSWSVPQNLTSAYNPSGDYDPRAVVYGSQLVVFFESFDPSSGKYEISWMASSGSGWSTPEALVEGAGSSFNPAPVAAPWGLLLAWESYDPALGGGSGGASIAVMAMSADGLWSQVGVVSGGSGLNMEPACAAHDDGVWAFWSTNSTQLASGGDRDIVGRRCSESGWSQSVEELTPGDSGQDASPMAVSTGGELVVSWISNSTEWGAGADTDVVARVLGRAGWSETKVLSIEDGSMNDGGGNTQKVPAMAVHLDSVFVVWEAGASPDFTQQNTPTWLESVSITEKRAANGITFTGLVIFAACVAVASVVAYFIVVRRAGRGEADGRADRKRNHRKR